jgi:hypothetical protein
MRLPSGLNEHWTGTGKYKRVKKTFESESDAWDFINRAGIKGKTPYKCSFCGKYHIGG